MESTMFMTTADAEFRVPKGLSPPGVRMWSYLLQNLHMPWFHVTFQAESSQSMIFATHRQQWLDLQVEEPRRLRHDPLLRSIQLVSPGWMNGTTEWRMELLKELWVGKNPANESEVCIYVVETGARYRDLTADCTEEALKDRRKLFDAQSLAGS